ncbi:hypothetical protein AWH69_07280 [Janibacter melonis]|uniref:Colicin D immunity protein domain-containing protein n=1 Tax=Janibacter melonis TaxID=262209 RepID=A0A176QDH9_9MICO|nr:hypothetical protein [Janibacter melonis]OAB87829.1 hypothetical protein AWH69_07280 [Janibacter melonis]
MTHDVSDPTYRELSSQLVTGGARLDAFLVQFWSLYSSDDRVDDDERYDILQRFFYAMEDYEPDPELQVEDSIDADQERAAVAQALHDLTNRKVDDEGRRA